jgi:hypothetical protein
VFAGTTDVGSDITLQQLPFQPIESIFMEWLSKVK